MIPDAVGGELRVAVVAHSERQRRYLAELLEPNGIQVIADNVLRDCVPDRLNNSVADVLLVDLQEDDDSDLDLDALIDHSQLPMLFNDGDASKRHAPGSIAGRAWGRRLADKLLALVQDEPPGREAAGDSPALKLVAEAEPDMGLGVELGFDLDTGLGFPDHGEALQSGTPTATDWRDDNAPATAAVVDELLSEPKLTAESELTELPDLDGLEAALDFSPQDMVDNADPDDLSHAWSLEPLANDGEDDAPANEWDLDAVPVLSDEFGLADALGLDHPAPVDPAGDVNNAAFEQVPTLSEDFTLADALGEPASPPSGSTFSAEASLDEVPFLGEDSALSEVLAADGISDEQFVLDDLADLDGDADLANALNLDDLAGLAEEIEPAAVPWLGEASVDESDLTAPAMEADAESESIVPAADVPIWVLGASIGGPQAVKEFIAQLPADIPAAFIVAQHIGVGFVDLLAGQLDRVTALQVRPAESGLALRPGQIVVAPVEQRITFSEGLIALQPNRRRSVYSPCIDEVMMEVADAFGPRANAIVFSGMGSDGVEGARAIVAAGGMVWGQESSTCVISSMVDSAREAGVVSQSGAPGELGQRLLTSLNGEPAYE